MTRGMKSTAATTPLLNLACCPPGVQAAVRGGWCIRRDSRSCTRAKERAGAPHTNQRASGVQANCIVCALPPHQAPSGACRGFAQRQGHHAPHLFGSLLHMGAPSAPPPPVLQ